MVTISILKKSREREKKGSGMIKSSLSFIMGTACGIYIAQNYNLPNLRSLFNAAINKAKQIEHNYRKPKPRDDDK
ncbi:uncharacterized protein LOC125194878 [Salvia hispanica]|uniref:uncharacterized protein LOC125194878 n=1 Tax=Salvia hispanica TaxID=49212 RepID=UPI0020098EFA|nr:uncharacterized protein LOC125194878 [Salvia hispanica]